MSIVKKYNQFITEKKLSVYAKEWIKLLPSELTVIADNKMLDYKSDADKNNLTTIKQSEMGEVTHTFKLLNPGGVALNGDLLNISYYMTTGNEDGDPDYLSFDIHLCVNDNGLKILCDITYGDNMQTEFTLQAPNKVDVVHYNGNHSKLSPDTHWAFSDDSISGLVKFFNSFESNPKFGLSNSDFKFLDMDPHSYIPDELETPKNQVIHNLIKKPS